MKIATTRLDLATDEGIGVADIGETIRAFIASSGVASGVCVLTVSEPGVALSLASDFEDAAEDLIRLGRRWLVGREGPDAAGSDRADRDDPGMGSGGVLARCLAFPLRAANLRTGSWESILLLDAAGPRQVAVEITALGH